MTATPLPPSIAPGTGGTLGVPTQAPIAAPPLALDPLDPPPAPRAGKAVGGGRPGRVLGGIISAHAVVDYYSFIIVSLMPLLAARLDLSNREKALLLGTGSIMSGFIQPLVAWIGDKLNTRRIATIGLIVAAMACSTLGIAQNFWQLLAFTAVGAAGVGAFHPPAAAVVGQLSGSRRSLGVSLFFLAGMVGGMAGNVLAPYFVQWSGTLAGGTASSAITLGLQWQSILIVPGVLVAIGLARAIHSAPHRRASAHDDHAALPARERTLRWRAIWLLYISNATRFTVNTALVYLFVRWIETLAMDRAGAEEIVGDVAIAASVLNGKFQAAMQLGMGAAGLAAGWLLRVRHEKASLVLVPLLGAAAIAAMPVVDGLGLGYHAVVGLGLGLAALAGVGFGGTVPTVIALAQRLLPHRTSLASGMMMGGAWGIGFIGPPAAERIEAALSLDAAFFATAALLLVCSLLGMALPGRVLRDA